MVSFHVDLFWPDKKWWVRHKLQGFWVTPMANLDAQMILTWFNLHWVPNSTPQGSIQSHTWWKSDWFFGKPSVLNKNRKKRKHTENKCSICHFKSSWDGSITESFDLSGHQRPEQHLMPVHSRGYGFPCDMWAAGVSMCRWIELLQFPWIAWAKL